VHSKLDYRCPKGHCRQITWSDFKQGYRCPICRERKKEKQLGEILENIFPGKIRHLDNLGFLGRQSVDYSVCESRMAFEYDGRQHFEPVMFGSDKEQAELNFILQQERDERKNRLCKENNYCLIRISYREKLSLKNIKRKILLCKEEK
jgi:very-short-patch-repair endonuclease